MLDFHALNATPEEFAHRRREARTRGHPFFLWPEVPIGTWRLATRRLADAASQVLAGRLATLDPRPGVDAYKVALFTTGLGPLIGFWIQTGRVDTTPDLAALAALHLSHGQTRRTRVERLTRTTCALLHDHGVPDVVVLKGTETARHFPDPATRPSVDVDVLVRAPYRDTATGALEAAGFRLVSALDRPFRQEWVPEGGSDEYRSVYLTHGDGPISIDLHTSLTRTFSGTREVTLPAGPEHTQAFPAWGPGARILAEPYRTAFLTLHGADELKQLQLVKLVELHLVIRAADPYPWDALDTVLDRADARRFAWPVFALVERLIPDTVDPRFLARLARAAPNRLQRMVNGLELDAIQTITHETLRRRFMWAHGPTEFVRCAVALLRPHRTNAAPVGTVWRERLHRLRRGGVSLR